MCLHPPSIGTPPSPLYGLPYPSFIQENLDIPFYNIFKKSQPPPLPPQQIRWWGGSQYHYGHTFRKCQLLRVNRIQKILRNAEFNIKGMKLRESFLVFGNLEDRTGPLVLVKSPK